LHQTPSPNVHKQESIIFYARKWRKREQRTPRLQEKKSSSSRTIQKPFQVKACTFQLHFVSLSFLVCLFGSIWSETRFWFFEFETISLRFWFSIMIRVKPIVLSCSTWKNEANHV
jgi:hypothetical protein